MTGQVSLHEVKSDHRERGGSMADATLRIGLAAARNPPSVAKRLETVERFLEEADTRDVAIVCFPEAFIPGLRGFDFPVPLPDQCRQWQALETIRAAARARRVAVVMGMEWETAAGCTTPPSSSRG